MKAAAEHRVAIIGTGAMAREHIKAFRDVPGVTVCGIYGRTRHKAEALAAEFDIGVVADSIEELHRTAQPDLVQVSVYETGIRSVLDQALAFPWRILMEKPIGLDHAEAIDILQQAKSAGRHVYAGLNRRAMSSTVAALSDLTQNSEPRFIHVQDQQSLETARAIGHAPEVVANWMYANSIHLVDYLLAFGRGDVTSVEVVHRWNADDPALVLAKVSFSSGDIGLYEALWAAPGPWSCTISTRSRRWELKPLERAAFQDAGTRKLVPVEPDDWDQNFKPGFRRQAEWMIAEAAGQSTPLPSLETGVKAMQLVRDIYR